MTTKTFPIGSTVRFNAGSLKNCEGRVEAGADDLYTVRITKPTAALYQAQDKLAQNVRGIFLDLVSLETKPQDDTPPDQKQLRNIVDRIRKLYAKAESAKAIGSLQEAEAFASGVQKMLEKYKLDMSDVEFGMYEEAEPIGEEYVDLERHGATKQRKRRVWWIQRLASSVAHAHFCKILVVSGSSNIYFVGRPSDRQVATFVFTTLVRTAEALVKKGYDQAWKEAKDQGSVQFARGFKESFLKGFVDAISERYAMDRKERRTRLQAMGGNALVRIDNALQKVSDHVNQKYTGKVGATKQGTASHNSGYARGQAAGRAANLKGNAMGGGSGGSPGRLGSGS